MSRTWDSSQEPVEQLAKLNHGVSTTYVKVITLVSCFFFPLILLGPLIFLRTTTLEGLLLLSSSITASRLLRQGTVPAYCALHIKPTFLDKVKLQFNVVSCLARLRSHHEEELFLIH